MNKENYFIKQIKNNTIIGDDGAVIYKKLKKNEKYVYSSDGFFENVHFKTSWMTLKQIAIKSMLVNISDAIAMNANPKYALITIAIPASYSKSDLRELSDGFKKIAKKYKIKIIGGDTLSNIKLDISVTIISVSKKPIFRSGTNINDLVCYTGTLGGCKKDLELLLKNKKVSNKSRFIKPKLRGEFFYEIAPFANSALDISDGLFFELERLSKVNKLGFELFYDIKSEIGCSGEEYEMLFTINPKYENKIQTIANKHNVTLNIFAKAIKGKFKNECQGHHF